ncbi:hypothetical protein HXX76_008019 [Chlamydomonas incerta]|uniref:Uncharacterized protein n=1 Tax=Chlamydomonas incerta TaxID=51695 RepID=A0A835SYY7_CHLIN|nr:hypothetical protein HXX76_008019 [Chlamydomonas incerta]|eukprot:KAG2434296.1 hypothetical protein HXX76_008019 [Chlamydomonas incerta]
MRRQRSGGSAAAAQRQRSGSAAAAQRQRSGSAAAAQRQRSDCSAAALIAEWASLSPAWAAQARSCGLVAAVCQSILARRHGGGGEGRAFLPCAQLHLLRALLGLLRRDAGTPQAPAHLEPGDAAAAAASITEVLLRAATIAGGPSAAPIPAAAAGGLAAVGWEAVPAAVSTSSATAAASRPSSREELVLALSSAAALVACQAQGHMASAGSSDARGDSPARGCDALGSSCNQAPVMLPLLPLLGAVVAGDLEAAEVALRRLNRRLSRPFAQQQQQQHRSCMRGEEPGAGLGGGCGDGRAGTCSSSGRGSSMCADGASTWSGSTWSGSTWSGTCSDGGRSSMGGSWASGEGRWKGAPARPGAGPGPGGTVGGAGSQQPSLLLVVQQAERLAAAEAASCRVAAARLCGRRWASSALAASMRQEVGELPVGAAEMDAAAFSEGALVALTSAAADTRCHLGCEALLVGAMPRLLQPPRPPCGSSSSADRSGSTSVAHSAVALLNNLAAPRSETHRRQLRRLGILGPLLGYLGSALSPPATVSPADLAAELGAVEMALRVVGWLSGSSGSGEGGAVQGGEAADAQELRRPHLRAAAKLSNLQSRLQSLGEPVAPAAAAAAATASSPYQRHVRQACSQADAESPASPLLRTCLALVDAVLRRVYGGSAAAVAGTPCGRPSPGALRQHGAPEPSAWERTPEAAAVGEAACFDGMTFQSELVVGGRQLQLLSVVRRHEERRPDGSVEVRYTFQDRVVPSPT